MSSLELDAQSYTLLAYPERWRMVCSALPLGERPVNAPAYERWASANLHTHRQREILFCIEGGSFQRFDGRTYRCRPGTVFLFGTGEEHARGYPPGRDTFVHLWIMVLADDVIANLYGARNGQAAEPRTPPWVFKKAEGESLIRAWRFAKAPPAWASAELGCAMLRAAIFPLVCRALENWLAEPAEEARATRRREIVAVVQRHIETHLSEAEDLDTLAHISGYSKFHFTRMFRACTGQTVHGYIDQCRETRARELLAAGTPCKAIAGELGFASPAAFSNWRRRRGV